MRRKLLTTLVLAAMAAGCSQQPKPVLDTLLKDPAGLEIPQDEKKRTDFYAVIDKSDQHIYVKVEEMILAAYPVSTGKNPGDKQKSGDWRTPEGNFYLADPVDSSTWRYKGKGPRCYGPFFFRVRGGRWGGIGLHGTNGTVGTPKSRGCIRMNTPDLLEFKTNYYHSRMPLTIQE